VAYPYKGDPYSRAKAKCGSGCWCPRAISDRCPATHTRDETPGGCDDCVGVL